MTTRCAPTGRILPFNHSSSIARLIPLPVLASKTVKLSVVFIRFLHFSAEADRHFVKVTADLFEAPRRDIGPYRHRHILSQSVIPPRSGGGKLLPLALPGQPSGDFTERQSFRLRCLDGTQRLQVFLSIRSPASSLDRSRQQPLGNIKADRPTRQPSLCGKLGERQCISGIRAVHSRYCLQQRISHNLTVSSYAIIYSNHLPLRLERGAD